MQLVADFFVGHHLVGAVDAGGDGVDLLPQRHVAVVERRELRGAGFHQPHDGAGELFGALGAFCPVLAENRLDAMRAGKFLDRGDLVRGVGGEAVDPHHHRHAELFYIVDVASEIGAAFA